MRSRAEVAGALAELGIVTAELEAHGRKDLVGELRLAPGREALVERGRQHRCGHALVDRRLDGPATLPRVGDPAAEALQLRVGREGIVTFPNFGHWRARLQLALGGRMPVSRTLPYEWYDTPNIHLCTFPDFEDLCDTLGIEILPDPVMGMRQGYMLEDNYGSGYRQAPGFKGIGAQPQLDHRYLNEDVGYGLVFMAGLGRQVGVPTPNIDAMIRLTSVLMARDYASESLRTPTTLGIDSLSTEELRGL